MIDPFNVYFGAYLFLALALFMLIGMPLLMFVFAVYNHVTKKPRFNHMIKKSHKPLKPQPDTIENIEEENEYPVWNNNFT